MTRRRMNNRPAGRLLALGVVALLAAACGTTAPLTSTQQVNGAGAGNGLGGSTGTQASGLGGTGQAATTGGAGAVPGGSGSGLTPNGGPSGTAGGVPAGQVAPAGQVGSASKAATVKLGFLLIDYSGVAASFGFSGSADVFQGFKEMVSFLNKHGGLAGRQIKPDYYSIDGTSTNATTAYQAACTHFIQDAHVEAVVSDGNYNPTFSACMAKAHLIQIDVSTYGFDTTGQRQNPNYLTPTAFGVDRYSKALIQTEVAAGVVARGQKIGVVIEGCPNNVRAYNDVWVPVTKQYGLQVESEQTVCNNGTGDLGTETSQIQNAVLKFRTDGVTSVSVISFNEGFILTLFAQGAQQQDYHPLYLLTSVALPERGVESQGNGLAVPKAQLAQIRGMGWVPISDTDAKLPFGPPAEQAQQKLCKQMSPSEAGAGNAPDPGVRRDFLGHFLRECDTMLLLRQIMTFSGGQLVPTAVRSVYARALNSLTSASDLGGGYRTTGSRTDGVFAAAPFAYQSSCQCVRYTGPTRTFS